MKDVRNPRRGSGVPALRRGRVGALSHQCSAEPAVQQIGNEQQAVRMRQLARLQEFVSIQLEDGIERQKLDACACVEDVAGNVCEDLLHHTLRAGVAILEGLTEEKA